MWGFAAVALGSSGSSTDSYGDSYSYSYSSYSYTYTYSAPWEETHCVSGPLYGPRTFDPYAWCGYAAEHTGYYVYDLYRCERDGVAYVVTSVGDWYTSETEYYRESDGQLEAALYCSDCCGCYLCPGCCQWRGADFGDCATLGPFDCPSLPPRAHTGETTTTPPGGLPPVTRPSAGARGCGCGTSGAPGLEGLAPLLLVAGRRRRSPGR